MKEATAIAKDGAFTGRYVHRISREVYALKVVPGDLYERTHKLHNAEHHWEGTEEQFKAEFERF